MIRKSYKRLTRKMGTTTTSVQPRGADAQMPQLQPQQWQKQPQESRSTCTAGWAREKSIRRRIPTCKHCVVLWEKKPGIFCSVHHLQQLGPIAPPERLEGVCHNVLKVFK